MKPYWKLALGVLIGLTTALLIWAVTQNHITAMWLSGVGGIGCIGIWAMTRNKGVTKVANKMLCCILCSMMAALPVTVLRGEDTYAGYNGSNCYCIEPADIQAAADIAAGRPPTQPPRDWQSITLTLTVDETDSGAPEPRIISMTKAAPEQLVDWETMRLSLLNDPRWGIDLNQSQQFTKNGRPVSYTEVPFKFQHDVGDQPFTLYPERTQHRVALETTSELNGEFTQWQRLTAFSIPTGTTLNIQDTPEGVQTFYRLRVLTPQEVGVGPNGEPVFQPAGAVLLGCGIGLLVGVGVIGVLAVRACAKNKKKFQQMTNQPPAQVEFNLTPAPAH